MNRKLLILDGVLLAAAFAAGIRLRYDWLAAQARERATLHRAVKPASLPPLSPLREPPAVTPANYIDVAQKLLFDPSRNPDVPVEPPPPPPAPPPPPPMPPLPVFHGLMNLDGKPLVVLSLGANGAEQAMRAGDQIGQFTLVSVSKEGLTFDWNGQKVTKTAEELEDRGHAAEVVAQAASAHAAAAAAPPAPAQPALVGPGQATAFGFLTCNMNDGLDPGTVKQVDGASYRKTVNSTPFGKTCTWDPVK